MSESNEILANPVKDFFSEPLLSAKQTEIDKKIKLIYRKAGFIHPLLVPPGTDLQGKAELLKKRIPIMQIIRNDFAEHAKAEEFGGHDGDLALFSEIGVLIGEPLDQILISQLDDKSAAGKSWMEVDPSHANQLRARIRSLLDPQNRRYQKFFEKYLTFRQSLERLSAEVLTEKSPEKLDELVKQFEEDAVAGMTENLPFSILFGMSELATLPQDSGQKDHYELLEPNLRVIMKLEPEQKLRLIKLNQDLFKLVTKYYQQSNDTNDLSGIPRLVAGIVVVSAGTESLSQSVGEAFDSNGLAYLINQHKNRGTVENVYKQFTEDGKVPDYSLQMLSIILLSHEAGHKCRQINISGLEEMVPDMTMVLAGIDYIRKKTPQDRQNELLKDFLLHVTAEYVLQTRDNDREYRRSANYIVNMLIDHKIIVSENDAYRMDLTPIAQFRDAIAKDHQQLLIENDLENTMPKPESARLLKVELGDEAKTLVEAVLKDVRLT